MSADPNASNAKLDPFALLRESTKRIPALRWAYGVIGIAAAAVIVQALVRTPVFGIAGFLFVVVAMVIVFLFSRVVSTAARATKPVVVVFMWFVAVVAMLAIGMVFLSAFFNEPWPLKSQLFAQEVTRRAEASGLDEKAKEAAKAAEGLSEEALLKLVEIGDSRQMLGWFDPKTGVYHLSPIPSSVRELYQKGLIAWETPVADFENLLRRLGQQPMLDGKEPQVIRFAAPLSETDRDALAQFNYHLNDRGLALYKVMQQTLVQQIKHI